MCTVSAIGDDFTRRFPTDYPFIAPHINPHINRQPFTMQPVNVNHLKDDVDVLKAELSRLSTEMLELKQLLLAAKKFDEATGQKDCEMQEKIDLIRKIAILVGVDISEVFP